jgi:hypothetical protein
VRNIRSPEERGNMNRRQIGAEQLAKDETRIKYGYGEASVGCMSNTKFTSRALMETRRVSLPSHALPSNPLSGRDLQCFPAPHQTYTRPSRAIEWARWAERVFAGGQSF